MDFLKRQWWWVLTIGLALIGSGVAGVFWYLAASQEMQRKSVLSLSMKKLNGLDRFYNDDAVRVLGDAAAYRQKEFEEAQKDLKMAGSWDVLVPGIFPEYRESTQVYEFKNRYPARLAALMQTLNAGDPAQLVGGATIQVSMLAKPDVFYTAPWIPERNLKSKAEVMADLRNSQDDLWLQQDICLAIKRANDVFFDSPDGQKLGRTVAAAVVKELHEIGIGRQFDQVPAGGKGFSAVYAANSPRFRYVLGGGGPGPLGVATGGAGPSGSKTEFPEAGNVRAPTLTGHAGNNNGGRYRVLPFRIAVVADAGNYLELVRQLGGTRSFITVENVQYSIIPESEAGYRSNGVFVTQPRQRLEVYGRRALAHVVITGESLIFEVPGGRPTLEPKTAEAGSATAVSN